jgi:hypothetical protein
VLNAIIGGLLLPFEIYFQPQAFRRRVNQYALSLEPYHTLLEALGGFKDPAIRRGIAILFIQFLIALLWLPVLSYAAYLLIPNASWSSIQSGLSTLPTLALALAVGTALEMDITSGITFGIGIGVIFGVSSSVNSAVLSSISNLTGMEVGVIVDRGLANPASSLSLGISTGLIVVMFGGIFSVRWTWISVLIVGIVLIGWFHNSSTPVVSNSFVMTGIILTVSVGHLLFLPFQFALGIAIWLLLLLPPSNLLYGLWRICPLCWDEFLIIPLPGSTNLLMKLYKFDPVYGQAAISHVSLHPFQRWLVERVTKKIEKDEEGWS